MSDIEDLEHDLDLAIDHNIELQEKVTTLESHNRDLLAANQVMREALQALHDDVAEYQRINNIGGYDNHCKR